LDDERDVQTLLAALVHGGPENCLKLNLLSPWTAAQFKASKKPVHQLDLFVAPDLPQQKNIRRRANMRRMRQALNKEKRPAANRASNSTTELTHLKRIQYEKPTTINRGSS
jgi:hypothetical protein